MIPFRRAVAAAVTVLGGVAFGGAAAAQDGSAAWKAGKLYVPAALSSNGKECLGAAGSSCAGQVKPGKHPVILFMHGCGGPRSFNSLKNLGAVVAAPNSFAGGLNCESRDATSMRALFVSRQADVRHALEHFRTAPWADPQKLVLVGFSHGGMLAALLPGDDFKARVVIAWTCYSPKVPTVDGLRGKGPVLGLFGSNDNSYRDRKMTPRCGEHIKSRPAPSRYVTIPGAGHDIVEHRATVEAIQAFIPAALQ